MTPNLIVPRVGGGPSSAMGYRKTISPFIFEISQGIALYPPPPPIRSISARGKREGVSQLKLPLEGLAL